MSVTGLEITACGKQGKTEYSIDMLLSVLFMTGWAGTIFSSFEVVEHVVWLFAAAGSLVCIVLLFLYDSKWQSYIFPAGCFLGAAGIVICALLQKGGIMSLANDVLDFMTGKSGTIHLDYPNEDMTFAVVTVLFGVILFAAWTARAIRFREKGMIFLPLLVTAGLQIVGFTKADWSWLFLIFGMIIFFMPNVGKRQSVIVLTVLAGVSAAAALAAYGMYSKEVTTTGIAEEIKDQIHAWRYDSASVSMPEGDLSNLGIWEKSESKALTIQMDQPQKLYLRGLVGDVYTGVSWEPLDAKTRQEAEDTFYWLHKSGYFSQSSIAEAYKLVEEPKEAAMTITNSGACRKYQYLPYALSGEEVLDANQIGDGSTKADGQTVTLSYLPGSIPEWYMTEILLASEQDNPAVQEYLKQEQTYREFVYEHELQITNAAVGVCKRVLGEERTAMTLSQVMDLIYGKLDSRMSYDETIRTLNGKNDFLQYTLEQNQSGYSVHYATITTLMLRYLGVPARYVEGYFLSAEEAAQYEKGDTIVLTENHAHAWAELYLDGVGWIPFETTPGYIDEEEIKTAQQIAAGADGMDGLGRAISRNSLTYKPPIVSQETEETDGLSPKFRLTVKDMIHILLILLAVAIIIFLIRTIMRYRKFAAAMQAMKAADHKEAIAMQYGYAAMLLSKASVEDVPDALKAKELNQEAMFSMHTMNEEQRIFMEQYAAKVLALCKEQWNGWKRFRYHYILWLYR